MTDSIINRTHTLQAADFPISNVTVYNDRAEVKRSVGLKLDAGLNRVLVENVANSIIGDSIRVDGQGAAIIHEVQFKGEWLDRDEVTSPKIEALKAELDELKRRKEVLEETNGLIEKQLNSLGDILGNFGKSALVDHQPAGGIPAGAVRFDSSTEQSLEMLYGFHERKSKQLKERQWAQNKEMDELKEKMRVVKRELEECWAKGGQKNSISVDLENGEEQGEEILLILTYQVNRASWAPSYDVRVEEADGQLKKGIKINYFGMVRQRSGEKWENVQLALSTAQPNCGTLPPLGTTYARFYRPPAPPSEPSHFKTMAVIERRSEIRERLEQFDDAEGSLGGARQMRKRALRVADTVAEEQILSTTFAIPSTKTIPDDESEHKVTIAVLDLDCLPHFDCVPSKNTNVFMSASVVNSSAYPLLAGQASIYFNNCFNQKVRLDSISPGDKFDVPLGVYAPIKVAYKPTNKFHHQTGMLNKSSNLVNEQKIVAKNSGGQMLLTILEPIPKPTDEKIKIRLLSPELTTGHGRHIVQVVNGGGKMGGSGRSSIGGAGDEGGPSVPDNKGGPVPGARLNGDNNLEWTIQLGTGQEAELVVKWEAEYPPSEKLEFEEKREK